MKNLLKADFYRISKSKLLKVMIILCVAFPLVTALLYLAINKLASLDGVDFSIFNGKALISGSFSLSSNLGLVIPIFSGIFICKDLSDGTLRNKIINGCTRIRVYLSHLISSIVFNVLSALLYTLCNALFGCILLGGYGVELDGQEIKYLLIMVLIGCLTFAFVATVTTFFALVFKNMPLTMILTVAFGMLTSLTSVLDLGLIDFGDFKPLLNFIPSYLNSSFANASALLESSMPETREILFGITSCLFFGCLNTMFGMLIFKKKDLK